MSAVAPGARNSGAQCLHQSLPGYADNGTVLHFLLFLDYGYGTGLSFYIHMDKRMHRLLLVLVTLALVISPLRGALAFPDLTALNGDDHCAQMPDGKHSMADKQRDACDQGCGGDCCDGACNSCVHGSIALAGSAFVIPETPDRLLIIRAAPGFSARTHHPPLRPPISLPV